MKEKAYAKINLYLHICGKTTNNYHLINSLMCFVDLYDVIEAENYDGIKIVGCDIPQKENLVYKVVAKLQEYIQREHEKFVGAKIKLTKNIPIGAGLGGGSADAAATLRLLPKLWGVKIPDEIIHKIASELGSDIVACVVSKPVIATGTGNDISAVDIDLKDYFIVLVNPMEEVSTPQVYAKYGEENLKSICENEVCISFEKPKLDCNIDINSKSGLEVIKTIKKAHNALQDPAIEILPKIVDILMDFEKQRGCLISRMSGSGATCFGIFENHKKAENTADIMRKKYGWAVVAKFV